MSRIHIVDRFSPLRNFRSVSWRSSFTYNSLRYLVSGLVFGLLFSILRVDPGMGRMATLLFTTVAFPIVAFLFFVPLSVAVRSVVPGFPLAKWFALFLGVLTGTGDPIIWLATVAFPNTVWIRVLIPLETPPFFSLQPFIYVIRASDATELFYSGSIPVDSDEAHSNVAGKA